MDYKEKECERASSPGVDLENGKGQLKVAHYDDRPVQYAAGMGGGVQRCLVASTCVFSVLFFRYLLCWKCGTATEDCHSGSSQQAQ